MLQRMRRGAQPLLDRAPWLKSFALDAVDVAARGLLWPFRLGRPSDREAADRLIESQTESLNRAAEQYFATYAATDHLLDKPFSEAESCARRLVDAGVLMDGLRLEPGDTVLELGAGTCWLSHFLNRFGCPTISVDVSSTALALGRRVFESDQRTRWELKPQFLVYDGRSLPMPDASVDRIVICDAYHHIPNPGVILREMRRVLRSDGIVAMSEPGRGHAESASSVAESATTGVLENELVLENVADLARQSGFAAARVIVAPERALLEVDAHELRAFMGGRGFARYWRDLRAELDGHHFILLFAGNPQPTTARPRRLKARIRQVGGQSPTQIAANASGRLTLALDNLGDTRWLATEGTRGWTRIGAHLSRADASRTPIDPDWLRVPLPHDIEPESRVRVDVTLPPIAEPGDYIVTFDLVIEGMAWFADRGSMPLDARVTIG